ncbi:MAG TPA: AmmeMemoRadiSam system protein B [Caldilineae bacterium]|nr:AmmeMemoRadiSam system protein B [Caldilineae bacterium]
MPPTTLPKLRPLDIQQIMHEGRPSLLVQDPLNLSERYLVLPQALGPALMLCDGQHDTQAIAAALVGNFGIRIELDVVEALVEALDQALFLENERSATGMAAALQAYRDAPFRAPRIAGDGYPADPGELRLFFDKYLHEAGPLPPMPASGKVIFSPHIDYQRGGHVYARVWKRAVEMAKAADLVVVLATDHFSGDNQITLTRQNYATPYGVLPTNAAIVDQLAEAIGEDKAFAGELYHTREHSIELVVTWLHHMREGRPVELVPILTGSFHHLLGNSNQPEDEPALRALLDILAETSTERHVLVVASGDLAHIGPAFGAEPVGIIERADLRVHDDALIERLAAGDANGFWDVIKRYEDSKNVCGVAPFYLSLKLAGPVEGEQAGYAVCPADQNNTSVVSVCGMVFG